MKPKIYFDGLCPLCSREIAHYRKRDVNSALDYVDISLPDFNAAAEHLNQRELERFFHVRGSDGKMYQGVDAFVKIWEVLPGFGWLAVVAKNPFVRPFLVFGYRIFAWLRPYLPRKKRTDACETDVCRPREAP